MATRRRAAGSNYGHVTASRLPVPAQPVSSSWETMARPVPFGLTGSGEPGEHETNLQSEQNRASYITTQPNRDDIMAAIASEFQRQAQESLSQRASSLGNSSRNSQHSLNRNTESLMLENTDISSGSRNTLMAGNNIHTPNGNIDPNNVRPNRTSQLRHNIAAQNRQVQVQSANEQMHADSVNANHSPVPGSHGPRARRSQRARQDHIDDAASDRFYYGFEQQSYQTPLPAVATYENDNNQKSILDLMTRGFRTFTTEMADVIIDKMKPENESFARKVGKEVKQSTDKELKSLREKLEKAEARINELEAQNASIKGIMTKEKDDSKKELETEILRKAKLYQEQSQIITKLQGDLQKVHGAQKEKEKLWRKAELKAKAEEQKRIKIEEEYTAKLKDMQKQLDKAKGDLLVQKSLRRVSAKDTGGRKNIIKASNSLDPDETPNYSASHLDPNCLQ